ncbi:uncharacterized protein LOC124209332 [Daphnia pulex]|uniref:uncharacterized protein LOC124209332 n=1 Tax=Daphnia pulex TaxID=6669 RepID=UPI001EDCCE6D|nr:uncharacterized protein LOC124209332 [Daphnia pulex]
MAEEVIEIAALGRRFQLGDLYNHRNDCIVSGNGQDLASVTNIARQLNLEVTSSSSASKWELMDLDEHHQASVVAGLIEKYRGASNFISDVSDPSQATINLRCHVQSKKESLDVKELIEKEVSFLLNNEEEMKKSEATHVVVGVVYGAEAYCVLTQDLDVNDENDREEAEEKLTKLSAKFQNALEDGQTSTDFADQFEKEEVKQLNRMKCRLYADNQTQAVRECGFFDAYKNCLKLIEEIQKSDVETNKAVPIAAVLCPLKVFTKPAGGWQPFEYRDVDADLMARCSTILDELDQVGVKLEAIRKNNKKVSRPSLRQFGDAVIKYKELAKKSLKNAVVKARGSVDEDDREIEKIADIIENHPLFKPSKLRLWLAYKEAESEMAGKLAGVPGIIFIVDRKQLDKDLADSFGMKYALVLTVPPLDEKTKDILEEMKDYVEDYTKLVAVDDDIDMEEGDEDKDDLPWHMALRKKKQVMDRIREFASHVEKNKHLDQKVRFVITPAEPGKASCRYSVYEDGNLLKENLSELPTPPTGLRIQLASGKSAKKSTPSIRLEWDYKDLGYPFHFCVESKPKNSSDSWTQQKTAKAGETQMILNVLKSGSELEIRVAADTAIGRSEFSDVIDSSDFDISGGNNSDEEEKKPIKQVRVPHQTKQMTGQAMKNGSAHPTPKTGNKGTLQPPSDPQVEWVTQTTAELTWSRPSKGSGKVNFSYQVRYLLKNDEDDSAYQQLDVPSTETGCRLENLEPETTYFINIFAVSDEEMSAPSQTVELTTKSEEVRFAETILNKCKKIGSRNGMDLFAVPLTKTTGYRTTADRFVFGRGDGQQKGRMQHRTILVMGATGSGKTTLINGMINYIFNVQWEDTFRFQLIQEQTAGRSQVDSQTSRITAYDIHHAEGFRVPYSLTIVDTPGYGDTKGLDRDQEITEMVRKFFEDKDGIQELDVIGFVAQASLPRLTPTQIYIFDSVLSIFGNDVKENINFLLTFADSQVPPVLSAISQAGLPCPIDADTGKPLHNKFNNSGFFCSSRESGNTADKFNRFFWQMGMENFQRFFTVLATMKTKSLSLTKQVLDERKRLESTVDGLQPLIKIGLAKMEEMRKTKQMITNCQAQIDANENVEFEVEVNMPKKVENLSGYLTNCNKCYVTCHNPCGIPNDDGKMDCWAMDFSTPRETRSCRICPEKCIWNMHANQPYRWEYVTEKQATSSDAIKQKYEAELKKKLTAEELVKELEKHVEDNNKIVLQRVDTVSRCIQQLDAIALRPNPFSTPQYIDLIIDAEQQEKRLGFKERIESLKKLRQMAVITSKVRNNESLLTSDRKDDVDGESTDDEEDDGETADAEDDDGASFQSLDDRMKNLMSSTDGQKFQSSFFNH